WLPGRPGGLRNRSVLRRVVVRFARASGQDSPHQVLGYLGGDRGVALGTGRLAESNGLLVSRQVGDAVRALRQVLLEARSFGRGQSAVQVVHQELDQLLARHTRPPSTSRSQRASSSVSRPLLSSRGTLCCPPSWPRERI